MGNCSGKSPKKESHAMRTDRKKVYQAQDTLVRALVDTTDGSACNDEGDADSVGPGIYIFILKSYERRTKIVCLQNSALK